MFEHITELTGHRHTFILKQVKCIVHLIVHAETQKYLTHVQNTINLLVHATNSKTLITGTYRNIVEKDVQQRCKVKLVMHVETNIKDRYRFLVFTKVIKYKLSQKSAQVYSCLRQT